jgi:hypothetical protein
MTLRFTHTTDEMALLAAFVSQLIREGITFTIARGVTEVTVTLTGGF